MAMQIEFDKITLSITENGAYRFVLTPSETLVSDTKMCWEIAPQSGAPSTMGGTVVFAGDSASPQIIIVTPTAAQNLDVFEFRLYEVVPIGDGEEVDILLGAQMIMPKQDAATLSEGFGPEGTPSEISEGHAPESSAVVHGLVFTRKDGVQEDGANLQHILFGTVGSFSDTALIDAPAETLRIHLNPAYYAGSYDAFVNHLASVIEAGPLYVDFTVALAADTDGTAPVDITPADVEPADITPEASTAESARDIFDLQMANRELPNIERLNVRVDNDKVAEGSRAVTTITAADTDTGEAVLYSLSGRGCRFILH